MELSRKIFLTGVIAASVAVAGCVSYGGFAPGVSTMWEVRSKSGRPTDVRFSSGEEIWEYATGPEGIETYVVVFDGNDLVRSAQQVLTEDNIHRLIPRKTTREETRNLLGRPGDVYQVNGSEVWEWRLKPQGFAPEILVVYFGGDGLVSKVTRVAESVGESHRGRR
ncbi:MAG: hypothetical protein E6H49_18665 [Betaproteobacteria bacterium]|nr:MAG: hypothetical protein E6H49_18665 [Betaproteobacteria bacterium]